MSEVDQDTLFWADNPDNACAANGVTADGRSYHYSAGHNGYVLDEPQQSRYDAPRRHDTSPVGTTSADVEETAELVEALNDVRGALHELSPLKHHPVDFVRWVPAGLVQANDYNPNQVAPPEMELLRLSIDHDGYTQPIVTYVDGGGQREWWSTGSTGTA